MAVDAKSMTIGNNLGPLEFSMFAKADFVNLILQRSEILFDIPRSGKLIKAWMNGDDSGLNDVVERLGEELGTRTAADMQAEFETLRSLLDATPPKRVADIGCGYALIDMFISKAYKSHLVLIDIEQNDHRHFGFQPEGAAYSNLAVAKSFLMANGVAKTKIKTLNPDEEDLKKQKPFDLVLSLYSCGFHYPLATYETFFKTQVNPGGLIVVDVRSHTLDDHKSLIEGLGEVEILVDRTKSKRIVIHTPA